MRLNFKRIAEMSWCGGGPVVFPIVEGTGEEIENVTACSVETAVGEISHLTLTVQVRKPEPPKDKAGIGGE